MNIYPYRNSNINGMGDWFDDLTSYVSAPAIDNTVLDARDAMATSNPVDQTVLDARDSWATTGTAPPVKTSTASGGWFTDILNLGKEVLTYKTTTLPTGQNIYTRIDPLTGLPVAVTGTVAIPSGIEATIKANLPLIFIGAAALMFMSGKKGK